MSALKAVTFWIPFLCITCTLKPDKPSLLYKRKAKTAVLVWNLSKRKDRKLKKIENEKSLLKEKEKDASRS